MPIRHNILTMMIDHRLDYWRNQIDFMLKYKVALTEAYQHWTMEDAMAIMVCEALLEE